MENVRKWGYIKIEDFPDKIRIHIKNTYVDMSAKMAKTFAGIVLNSAERLESKKKM